MAALIARATRERSREASEICRFRVGAPANGPLFTVLLAINEQGGKSRVPMERSRLSVEWKKAPKGAKRAMLQGRGGTRTDSPCECRSRGDVREMDRSRECS
jgi:hypothetical protein